MPKDDEQETVTLSKAELESLLADRERKAKMPDDEKRLRAIIRDETAGILREQLDELFSAEDDDDEGKRRQAPKGTKGDLFAGFLGS